jgi:hypothetical protein
LSERNTDKQLLLPERVDQLLATLCVQFGFCLPPSLNLRLRNNPPRTPERFAAAVFRGEGLDAESAQFGKLRQAIMEVVAQHFERAACISSDAGPET